MEPLDVIGIGAINHDFIFRYKPGRDEPRGSVLDQGPEHLGGVEREVAKRIEFRWHHDPGGMTTQVGGSAYLAIKTIASMNCGLRTGLVAVRGNDTDLEGRICPGFPPPDEFDIISDRQWFFESESPPGRAQVLVRRGRRVEIRIAQGANGELIEHIEQRTKDLRDNDAFIQYLASARWIHISSLANFADFRSFVESVRLAKQQNRLLRCSIDPGYEYVQQYSEQLAEILGVADIVFLSETEAAHLAGGPDLSARQRVEALCTFGSDTRVLIVKSKNRHTLVHQVMGQPISKTFWHPALSTLSVQNDTGAGDVFAGGFIAGVLMDSLIAHQPAPVRLGARLAGERLRSRRFPELAIARQTARFLDSRQREERLNRRQRLRVAWQARIQLVVGFIIGVSSSVLATIFVSYLSE